MLTAEKFTFKLLSKIAKNLLKISFVNWHFQEKIKTVLELLMSRWNLGLMWKLHRIMQSWSIKIDIKLNIDDLNWSLDGQIIDNMKQENGHFYQFLTKIEILSSVSLEPEKMTCFILHKFMSHCHKILASN